MSFFSTAVPFASRALDLLQLRSLRAWIEKPDDGRNVSEQRDLPKQTAGFHWTCGWVRGRFVGMVDALPWGPLEVAPEKTVRVRIGPTLLWVRRFQEEWRLCWEPAEDGSDTYEESEPIDNPPDHLDHLATAIRFACDRDTHRLELSPQLADRPVVTVPEQQFVVPPESTVVMYVSSPIWLRVKTAVPGDDLVCEFPVLRPSDTWFGDSTREGELCYSTRTSCRLRLDRVPVRPYRALTRTTIRNRGRDELFLDRMKLPVENLSLYRSKDRRLWTQDVTLTRSDEGPEKLGLDAGSPKDCEAAALLSQPRVVGDEHVLVRAFTLLGRGWKQ